MNKLYLTLGSGVLALTLAACGTSRTGVLADKNAEAMAVQSGGGTLAQLIDGNISGDGNQVCNNPLINLSGTTWMGVKVDSASNGAWTGLTATINDSKQLLSFMASAGVQVQAVLVKGGSDSFLYRYDGTVMSDTGLRAPTNNGGNIPQISHYVICFTNGETPPPSEGWVKLRKIYDLAQDGFTFESYTYIRTSMGMNGAYDYPEPIFGGWPLKVTRLDAEGNATTDVRIVHTEAELDEHGGLYLKLPVGTYKIEEIPVVTTGGGMWVSTGANLTVGGTTTNLEANNSITVTVTAGAKEDAPVARFFNVCEIDGEVSDFDPRNLLDIRTDFDWACSLATEAQ